MVRSSSQSTNPFCKTGRNGAKLRKKTSPGRRPIASGSALSCGSAIGEDSSRSLLSRFCRDGFTFFLPNRHVVTKCYRKTLAQRVISQDSTGESPNYLAARRRSIKLVFLTSHDFKVQSEPIN